MQEAAVQPPDRSIRNVTMPIRTKPRIDDGSFRTPSGSGGDGFASVGGFRKYWIWGAAGLSVFVLAGLSLFVFRATSVVVTPRAHTIVFDQSNHFVAAPAASAATGTIPYTVVVRDYDDTATVPAGAPTHVETRAQGTITVLNDFSTSPVRLIKNTRFEGPGGLIYRINESIIVPAKKGNTPGSLSVTVVADQVGDAYNIAPTDHFTLPGLKSNPDMFAHVTGRSATAFAGGFSGDKPQVDSKVVDAARAEVRGRLADKARSESKSDGSVIFPDLMTVTYSSLADTTEGTSVRIHEHAHVLIPTFPSSAFARGVGATVSSDVLDQDVTLMGGEGFAAHADPTALATVGSEPLSFTLSGTATLGWVVDAKALTAALAGKDESAFSAIVKDFPGVEEAHARIEPFWRSTFPDDASRIAITIESPKVK